MKIKSILLCLAIGLVHTEVFSAEIKIGVGGANNAVIFFTGKIEKDDYKKIQKITKKYINPLGKYADNELRFILNSAGGDVEEAIKIGLFFRKTLAKVHVRGNTLIHESESDAHWVMNHRATEGLAGKYATQEYII